MQARCRTADAGEKHIYTLYDSGANLSCIHPNQIEGLETPTHLGRIRMIGTASEGHSGGVPHIEVTQAVRLDFYMNDVLLSDEFLAVRRCGYSRSFRRRYHWGGYYAEIRTADAGVLNSILNTTPLPWTPKWLKCN